MKRLIVALGVAAVVVGTTVSGALAGSTGPGQGTKDVCFLLPDPKTSVRWETQDRPAFIAAAKKAKISYIITNADGDAQKQRSQADQCLANGAKVVILVSLDFGSSLAIERAAEGEGREGHRVRPPGRSAAVGDIYISFDGKAVGVLQGKGVVAGLRANGKYDDKPVVARLNGGPTDNNSYLFKSGYDSVLNPLFRNGTFEAGPNQFVPAWDNQRARTIFEQMLVRTGNKIDAVAAANDGLANAVVTALKAKRLEPIPLSRPGCDGAGRPEHHLRLADDDRLEGHARSSPRLRSRRRSRCLNGQRPATTGTVPNKGKRLPAFIIPPVSITKANYKILFRTAT